MRINSVGTFHRIKYSIRIFPGSRIVRAHHPFSSLFPQLQLSHVFDVVFPSSDYATVRSIAFMGTKLLTLRILPPSLLRIVLRGKYPSLSHPYIKGAEIPSYDMVPYPNTKTCDRRSFHLIYSIVFAKKFRI